MSEPKPAEVLREQKAGYVQVWHCDPPPLGTRYKVYPGGDEWDTENEIPVRHIYQIEVTQDAVLEARTAETGE